MTATGQKDDGQKHIGNIGNFSHECASFLARAVGCKGTIWIDCLRVPAVDYFVAPRANAWRDQKVDVICVVGRFGFEERECALHSASLVTMNTTCYQCPG